MRAPHLWSGGRRRAVAVHRREERRRLEAWGRPCSRAPRRPGRTASTASRSPAGRREGTGGRRRRPGPRCPGSPAAPPGPARGRARRRTARRRRCGTGARGTGAADGPRRAGTPGSRGRRPGPRSRGSRWRPRGPARRRRRTRLLAVDDVGDRPGRVAGDGVDRDGDVPAEGEGLAAPDQHGRLHLAGDDVGSRLSSAPRRLRIVQVLLRAVQVLVDVGAPGAQQRRVGLVDHDLRAPAGELPQGVRTADVVDVAVGQQDPADVLDAAAERLQRREPCPRRATRRSRCRRWPARARR